MKIVTVVGARPQFIKAAAFSRAVSGCHEEIIVHTGQHFDANMSDVFFEELQIPKPKYNLGISGGSHGKMTGAMIMALEEVFQKENPDWLLIYGDTNSTMAGALAAVKLRIPIAHVEAGVRMGTLTNPEEVNRVVTDHVSQLLFTPTELERENLEKENLEKRAFVVGNIMYDSYLYCSRLQRNMQQIIGFDGKSIEIPEKYYYLTCHRQENTYNDEPLMQILFAMNQLPYPTVYPVHPRNQERALRLCRKNKYQNIILIKPVGYFESICLLKNCEKVVTDSGGLQCEAFYACKQCLTIFDKEIWPQTMVGYRNQLSKPIASDILEKLNFRQSVDETYKPFGDGHTAEQIIKIIEMTSGRVHL